MPFSGLLRQSVGWTNTKPARVIEHWGGTAWRRAPGPRPGRHSLLTDVAATSASNAWAVGSAGTLTSRTGKTLIMRRNDTTWKAGASR